MAVDGETVVVGAHKHELIGSKSNAGAAYQSSLHQARQRLGRLRYRRYRNGQVDRLRRTASVAVDGETVVVGAHKHDIGRRWCRLCLHQARQRLGLPKRPLTAFDGKATDEFGISVAVDGETVVVGAHKHDIGSKSNAGAAYVYTKPGSVWANATESAKPTASGGAKNDEFGSSVAIDGDTVMVGAYAHDNGDSDNTANSGAAYVFDTTDWYDIAVVSKDQKISHIVTGLTNDMGHNFRIRAENSNGFSDPSGYVVETPKAYPPARPVDFSAKQTDDGEVELAWDAHGYPLTVAEYQFTQNAGSGATWTTIAGSGPSTDSHTVDGLTAGTTYTFAVRAVNSAFSTASDSRSVTIVAKPGEPDPFITVAGDGHVWLGWRSPADFSISGYQYQQKTGGDFDDVMDQHPREQIRDHLPHRDRPEQRHVLHLPGPRG